MSALRVRMSVDVVDGGWYWRGLGVAIGGVRVPLWLFPKSIAFKRIDNGRYLFGVALGVPVLGTVLSYHGTLDAAPSPGRER